MPVLIALTEWMVGSERAKSLLWTRYGLVVLVSGALHFAVWQFRAVLEHRPLPEPKKEKLIEVTLVSPPKPIVPEAKSPEPAPKPPEPKKAEPMPQPKPVVHPKPAVPPKPVPPPRPKALPKPKPVVESTPEPRPKPEPRFREEPEAEPDPNPVPVRATPAKVVESPPAPVAPPSEPVAPTTPRSHAANSSREGHGGGKEEGNSPAHYLQRPNPEYPALAKRRNWEGRVVVRVKIMADGSCGHAEIEQSSGHDILDEAALEAVCKVRYAPNKRNGQAVEGWANVPINFNLEG